jgi:hypothetical protein
MSHMHHFLRFFAEVSRTCGSMFPTSYCLVVFCGYQVPLIHWVAANDYSRKLSFRYWGFSETGLPALPSRELLLGKGPSLLSSMLPTPVRDPPTDTPPLMPYRRFANASPGPAELATPSPRTSRIWRRVAVRRPDTTCHPGYDHYSQQSSRSWLAHYGIARYRRLGTLHELCHRPAEVS